MRKINVRFLLGLVTIVAVLAGATHLLHGHQVRRSAEVLLVQADNRLKADKPGEAIGYLQRYVKLNPADTAQRARLARALADTGNYRAAFFLLERVLHQESGRLEERRRLVEVAMRIGRQNDARAHLKNHLLKAHPDDAVLHDLLGQCETALGAFEAADKAFADSIKLDPSAVDVYLRHAAVLREYRERIVQPTSDPEEVLEAMVANNAGNFRAYLARVAYRRQYGPAIGGEDLPSALEQDVQRALELAPDDADVLLQAAQVARDARDEAGQARAREHLQRGLKLHPEMPGWYLGLAQLEDDERNKDAAAAWLRRGLEAVPGNVDLLWNLADLLIQTDRAAEALEVIAQLRKKKYPPAPLDYLSARLSIHKKDWREAADQLAKARAGMASWPDLAKQADFWLAHCHGRLGVTDLQIEAYQSALRVDESWAPARLGLAAALAATGDIDGAIREYRRLAQAPLEVYPAMARLMFLQRLVVAKPNWQPVIDVLNEAERLAAEKKVPASPDVPILRAEVAAAQGKDNPSKYDEARQILEAAQPQVLALRLALAALEQRLDRWDAAAGHLDQAERDFGDSADLRIARVRWVRQRYQTESLAHLARLEQSIEAFEPADKARLLHALASGYFSAARALPAGDAQREPALSEARRLWTEVGRLEPDHLTSRLFLFDLAIRDGDERLMGELLEEIRRIEGAEAGPLWRYGEAARLVMLARKSGELAGLDDAQALLTDAARQRPRWSRIPLLRTEIDELRNDRDAAIEHYRQAVGLGERNPAIIRRLVELLYREGQYREADQQLRELDRQQALISVELGRLGSEISARIDEYPRAIDLAQRTAEESNDYRDYVWLGQVLSLERNRPEEAEEALRDAIDLAPHEPAPRVALVRFLHAQRRTEEAEAELAHARELVAGEDWPLVLASYYEATQRPELAGEQYREALAADPSSPAALRKLAEFYLRSGRPREAEPHLRKLVDPDGQAADPDRRWARRNLAVALVARGDYASQRQALALLEENLKLDDNSVDRRAKAVVLASQQRRRPLREAIRLFEKLVQVEAPSNEDRFLLAQLYQADGNWPAARQQMRSLLAVQGDNPGYLAWYVRALLARGEAAQAESWLEQLVRLEPDSARTAELRAGWLVARGRYDEAIALVDGLLASEASQVEPAELDPADTLPQAGSGATEELEEPEDAQPPPEPAAETPGKAVRRVTAGAVARLLERLAETIQAAEGREPTAEQSAGKEKLLAAAEQRYREQAAADPNGFMALAGFLARQGRIDEALDLCEPGWRAETAEQVALITVGMLRSPTADAPHVARVEAKLREVVEQKPESVALLEALANLYDLKGDYVRAQQAYRKIIALNPKHMVALNNLALLTSYGGHGRRESLTLINRALAAAGPRPVLLDSRASVHLAQRRPGKAIEDLNEALADGPTAAMYFHLAQAHQMAGNRAEAAAALKQARQQGFEPSQLHPVEIEGYEKLAKELAGQ